MCVTYTVTVYQYPSRSQCEARKRSTRVPRWLPSLRANSARSLCRARLKCGCQRRMQAPSNMSSDGTADESVIAGLVQQLSDMHKSQRAASQLGGLLRSAVASAVMDRLLCTEGHSATERRAVARLLSDASRWYGSELMPHVPRVVVFSARALGDAEVTVRDAYVEVISGLSTQVVTNAAGKDVVAQMLRPLLSALEQPAKAQQQGAALAIREAVRTLAPAQLRTAVTPLCSAMRKHLRAPCSHARAAVLEALSWLLEALGVQLTPQLSLLLPSVLDACVRPDWRERAAAARVFHRLAQAAVPLQPAERGQVDSALATLRFDKVSVVRQVRSCGRRTPRPSHLGAARPSPSP